MKKEDAFPHLEEIYSLTLPSGKFIPQYEMLFYSFFISF